MTDCFCCVLHPTFPPTRNPPTDPANHPQPYSSYVSPDSTTWIRAKPEPKQSAKRDTKGRELVSVKTLRLGLALCQQSLSSFFFFFATKANRRSNLRRDLKGLTKILLERFKPQLRLSCLSRQGAGLRIQTRP